MTIGILGGGVWGSALAKLLSSQKVLIYSRDANTVKSVNEHNFNPKLKYAIFNQNVRATNTISDLKDSEYLFLAIPAQNIREVFKTNNFINNKVNIVLCSKGIEISTSKLLTDTITELVKYRSLSVLSGPSFSDEVAQDLPTAVTVATKNKEDFSKLSLLIKSKAFRIYYSDDLIGCQIGGSLKNIYAIAAGIIHGLNLGENAKSALISRSFVEMNRFAKILGSKKDTIFGLSGLGDLILTCSSLKSRNTQFGIKIANIKSVNYEEILNNQQVTEGYFTVKAVYTIAQEKKIEMPIMESIYNILYNKYNVNEELNKLLNRPLKDEIF